jgi:hypothetical protein
MLVAGCPGLALPPVPLLPAHEVSTTTPAAAMNPTHLFAIP